MYLLVGCVVSPMLGEGSTTYSHWAAVVLLQEDYSSDVDQISLQFPKWLMSQLSLGFVLVVAGSSMLPRGNLSYKLEHILSCNHL